MPGRPRSGGLNRGGMRRWAAKEGTGKGPSVNASPAEHRNEAIRLLDELALEHPTIPDYRFLLALCYREVPRSGFRPDIDAIVAASDKAASELEALVEKFPTVPDYRHELIVTYTLPTLRESSWSREFLPLAEDRLRKAWVLAQQLVLEHPNVPRYANARVSVQMRLASVLLRTNRPVEAERHYQQALRTQRSLDRRFPEVQGYHFRLLTLLDRLARLLRGQNRLTEARPLMEEAIEVSQTVWKKAPRTRMRRNLLADRYRRLGEVLNSLGEKEKAEEAFAKAREQRARPGRPQKMTR
jgi:tetratricopeptide (TPR) repeat protein